MTLSKVLKVVVMGMLRYASPNNGSNNQFVSRNDGFVVGDGGNHVPFRPFDHADDSRVLRSVLKNDLTYEPLVNTGNLDRAAQCGSVIQQVNGQKLNSIVVKLLMPIPIFIQLIQFNCIQIWCIFGP